MNKDRQWDGEYFDEIEAFLEEKLYLKFNIASPDGIPISYGWFATREEAVDFMNKVWVPKFKNQGYYSSNDGHIDLEDLADSCYVITSNYKFK